MSLSFPELPLDESLLKVFCTDLLPLSTDLLEFDLSIPFEVPSSEICSLS